MIFTKFKQHMTFFTQVLLIYMVFQVIDDSNKHFIVQIVSQSFKLTIFF